MTDKKIMKILAAIFLMRCVYWHSKSDFNYHMIGAAYDDAFDMLAYAANGNWDCLRQFGWSDEAEELINKIGDDIDFWDLEDLIKKKYEKSLTSTL